MNRMGSVLVLLFCAVGACPAELSGESVLQKSADAYAALTSYVGTTTVQGKAQFAGQKDPLVQTATATVTFLRPDKLRIEGKMTSGLDFSIISDGKDTWFLNGLGPAKYNRVDRPESAIAAMTGVAARAPTTIPGALMHLNWGYPFVRTEGSRVAGRELIGGNLCYKVVRTSPTGTTTFWVDSNTFLLRQMKEERNARQLADLNQRMQESLKRLGRKDTRGAASTMTSTVNLESFSITRINGPVDESLFQAPKDAK